METWRTLHPREILHAPGAISVYGGVSQASLESETSGPELSVPNNAEESFYYCHGIRLRFYFFFF